MGQQIFLKKIIGVMVSYHHVQYQKKVMIQSWENLVTDGQTNKGDFKGNVEHPVKGIVT